MSHRKLPTPAPFWRTPKIQDKQHPDFRPASDDLNLHPSLWKFKTEVYENSLADIVKAERNLAKLSENISPKQR